MTRLRTNASGSGAMSEAFSVPTGDNYLVHYVALHLSAAPTTSENFTITLDCVHGPNYDTLLYSLDLSAGSTTDLLWQPDEPFWMTGGDALDVVWSNTDTCTWGLLMAVEKL